LLAKDAALLAQEVDDLELAGVDPARHAHDQKPHGIAAHRDAMVARMVIRLGARRAMTTLGDTSRFRRLTFGTRRGCG
jgi:hypothetical protein